MDLPQNARVDALGRNHEGKIIYRVIVNGGTPMYLVDALTDTVDRFGKSYMATIRDQLLADERPVEYNGQATEHLFTTVVVPFDPEAPVPEPPLRGSMLNGLNAEWVKWYRAQGNGHSLIEAGEEGLRRLADMKSAEWANAPEPKLDISSNNDTPSQEWITWWRRKTGVGVEKAIQDGKQRIYKLRNP